MSLIISGSARLTGSLTVQHQVVPPAFVAVRGQLGAGSSNAASAPIAAQPWSTTNLPAAGGWISNGLVYGNGVYMVVSTTGQCFITSDGVTWTQGGNLPALPWGGLWRSMAYGDGVFVAAAQRTDGSSLDPSDVAARSTDNGQTWSSVTLSQGIVNLWYVAYGNGTFLVTNRTWNSGGFPMVYSTDNGQTWANTSFGTGGVQIYNTSPGYVNNRFVMIGGAYNSFSGRYDVYRWTSSDGISWSSPASIINIPNQLSGPLITDGANFVINPDSGVYSTNGGTNWAQAANTFVDMTYNSTANIFVALAGNGSVFYSDSANIVTNTWTSAGNITGSASTYWNNIATYDPNI